MRIDILSIVPISRSLSIAAVIVQRCLLWTSLVGILACFAVRHGSANEFVGVLALALEDDVAKKIGLSQSTRDKLRDLVDQRENDAVELAYELREMPEEQQAKKLAPFRMLSEKLGLDLLTQQQRDHLQAIRIARKGLASLAEDEVAKSLQLTTEQRSEVNRVLSQRDQDPHTVEREQKRFDPQLKALLTKDQLESWQQLSTPTATRVTATKKNAQETMIRTGESPSRLAKSSGKPKMRFSFRYAPWGEVIEWFATQADLSLVMDFAPQGTFNYIDQREYSAAEAIDLINSVLLTKGYTLVRRDRMLMVINLEDGIPPNLITEVSVDQLDDRGEYELVRCLFTLRSANAGDVEEEISRLVGPQGAVAVLDSSNQLLITETAGRVRTFRTIIEAAERSSGAALGKSSLISLRHVRASDVIGSWRKLMGLTDQENSTADGFLRIAQGHNSREIILSGRDDRVQEFKDLIKLLDMPTAGGHGIDAPQLEVYPITDADPTSVLEVAQTLMADEDDVRLASDPRTGNLVVLARPAQQRTIKATIDQMQQDRREVEVIRLGIVDPQLAMMSIEKLFGPPEGDETADKNALRVDADPSSRSLLIRGSQSQIAEVRALLTKMGEVDAAGGRDRGLVSGRGNLRMIPIDSATARRALDQMEDIWPTVRKNLIHIVTPSSSVRGLRRSRSSPSRNSKSETGLLDDQTGSKSIRFHYAAQTPQVGGRNLLPTAPNTEYPDVIVTSGDQGLLIASEDLEALDDFEQVFRTLTDRLFTGSRELGVFYLKFAKAEVAADLVRQVIGVSGSGRSSGGGGLVGKLAGAALGGDGGGLLGSLLGMGGGGGGSTTILGGARVIADTRLNALVVHASPKDLDYIEQMLEVLDTSASPEAIETIPRPRTIPVLHASASEIADMVRIVYASRLSPSTSSTRQEPTPEEVLRALSGQKNNERDIRDAVGEQLRLNISVDTRRNALIVVAPDWLFEEVKGLVVQLDVARPDLQETIQVVHTSADPEAVRNALVSIIGGTTTSKTPSENGRSDKEAKTPKEQPFESSSPQQAKQAAEQAKRRMEFLKGIEFFKAMQQGNAKNRAAKVKAGSK